MQSATQLYVSQARNILKANNQQAKINIKTISNNGIDFYILSFDEISSTMLLSQKWDKNFFNEKTAFVFIAERQNAGRGQKNNKWSSPAGNIYMTLLTQQQIEVIPYIELIATLAATQTVQDSFELSEKIKLKWVNDLFLKDKKIAGALIKSDIFDDKTNLQIGIGINVLVSPLQTSTCLVEHLEKKIEINQQLLKQIIQKICIKLVKYCGSIKQFKGELMNKYNERLLMKNEEVKIYDQALKTVLKKGKFLGINHYGHARLLCEDGNEVEFTNGRMRLQ